jgi:hypothetical protein
MLSSFESGKRYVFRDESDNPNMRPRRAAAVNSLITLPDRGPGRRLSGD